MSVAEKRNIKDADTKHHDEEEQIDEEEPGRARQEEQEGFRHDSSPSVNIRRSKQETTDDKESSPKNAENKRKGTSQAASSRASTHLDKKTQQMVAELYRLKWEMTAFQQSIQRPPVRPYTPDIFNSLSPYYNQYLVNSTIQDLLQEPEVRIPRGYGHRPTALGIVDPEIAWRMDNSPNPVPLSRLPGRLFHNSADWSRNMSNSRDSQGSTRLPPLPMPSFPRFNQSSYQPNRMTYDELRNFRSDLRKTHEKQAEKQAKVDYERTVQDWNRMNLSELRKLPPNPRYHFKKTIVSYLGTTPGSSRAIVPLTKELNAKTPEPIAQK